MWMSLRRRLRFKPIDVYKRQSYARVQDARALASVIGEEELAPLDKLYIQYGTKFEQEFFKQGESDNRSIEQTLDLGWALLKMLPREELDRVDDKILDKYYGSASKEEAAQ